jgi:hypothetical protein
MGSNPTCRRVIVRTAAERTAPLPYGCVMRRGSSAWFSVTVSTSFFSNTTSRNVRFVARACVGEFHQAKSRMSASGLACPLIGKLSTARCEEVPYSAASGTDISPIESHSVFIGSHSWQRFVCQSQKCFGDFGGRQQVINMAGLYCFARHACRRRVGLRERHPTSGLDGF